MISNIDISSFPFTSASVEEASKEMDNYPKHQIANNPWPYPFVGKVAFSIAYSNDAVFLKYYVSEENIRAIYTQPNDPVYKDSCVEFFIAFNGETDYYNFEFNCKGTCLVGYGPYKENRVHLKADTIKAIKTFASFKNNLNEDEQLINWELTLIIPKSVFSFHEIESLADRKVKVNFYKCGDDLPAPHFLCWNPIQAAEPNFHLPQFFGEANFV